MSTQTLSRFRSSASTGMSVPLRVGTGSVLGTTRSTDLRNFVVSGVMDGRPWIGGGVLREPIRARVESAGDVIVLSEPRTGIFGSGDNLASAVEDFRLALVEHRDALESSPALSADLADQLKVLQRYLQPSK